MDKIKVVWICHLSNSQIREHLKFDKWTPLALIRRILGKSDISDFAVWNTNGIREFAKFEDIELHIVAPHYHISGIQEFQIDGIHYHYFESEDDNLLHLIKSKITKKIKTAYNKNSDLIAQLVAKINPNIIHLIGAENPYYGESALSLPRHIPLVVELQTLLNDQCFLDSYPLSIEVYNYRSKVEAQILKRADYIGTRGDILKNKVISNICPTAKFLNIALAVGVDVDLRETTKLYDFVYFAADISKAVDHAIESFAVAKKSFPDITLHVVGGYSNAYFDTLIDRMRELGLGDEVDFTGKLPSYDDVIAEVRKARFALLPLKVDLVSGTIREAMANGLPVVTSKTPATPKLNEVRESVLLSDIGDFQAMADNMLKLLSDQNTSELLRENGARTVAERYSNAAFMQEWRDNYHAILNNER